MRIEHLAPGFPEFPCTLFQLEGTCILFDCPLLWSPSSNQNLSAKSDPTQPVTRSPIWSVPHPRSLSWNMVDAILLTEVELATGLAYVTEYTSFRGVIYATLPVMELLKLAMTEIVTNLENDFVQNSPYTLHDIETCLSRIKLIYYHDPKVLIGEPEIIVKAIASGSGLGNANWILEQGGFKIGYSSGITVESNGISKPLDTSALGSLDLLISASTTRIKKPDPSLDAPTPTPPVKAKDPAPWMPAILSALKNGELILFPVSCANTILQILHFFSWAGSHFSSKAPIIYLSVCGKQMLQSTQIFSEWMTESLSEKTLSAMKPLSNADLEDHQKLVTRSDLMSIFDQSEHGGRVILCGNADLGFGPGRQLLQTTLLDWKMNGRGRSGVQGANGFSGVTVVQAEPRFHSTSKSNLDAVVSSVFSVKHDRVKTIDAVRDLRLSTQEVLSFAKKLNIKCTISLEDIPLNGLECITPYRHVTCQIPEPLLKTIRLGKTETGYLGVLSLELRDRNVSRVTMSATHLSTDSLQQIISEFQEKWKATRSEQNQHIVLNVSLDGGAMIIFQESHGIIIESDDWSTIRAIQSDLETLFRRNVQR